MSLYKLLTPKNFSDLLSKESTRRIVPVDSTWYLPNLNKNAKQEFLNGDRLKGAVFFDIDAISDKKSEFPHMLPDLPTFNKAMSELGLKKDDILVVYDRIGNFSAPRCAWTLSVFGHHPVYLLNNFPLLKESGIPTETSSVTNLTPYEKSDYISDVDLTAKEVVSFEDMQNLVSSDDIKNYQVFDARSFPRFTGEALEPRPKLSSGHVPGAKSFPFTEVLYDNKTFPSNTDEMLTKLQPFLSKSHIEFDANKPTIAMCGTGVSGVIIKTALELAGVKNVKLYDGSWTEWVLRGGAVEKGN
ncbi:unnamed protein product [Kluyveromyces dobzhanskii CBS 2104]|uniref:Sulfurtransferase n=1 Tax=Kluyveromyces dobzhanskii CBS 2104 TaxID=1427455 RepID=A0A0A8L295_9SACH|nr:unnamed protein product [Kluyveromyces dobzhanskii CBS 2104]